MLGNASWRRRPSGAEVNEFDRLWVISVEEGVFGFEIGVNEGESVNEGDALQELEQGAGFIDRKGLKSLCSYRDVPSFSNTIQTCERWSYQEKSLTQ